MTLSAQQMAQLQARGIRWQSQDGAGLSRSGGAGPTDHKAFDLGSQTLMIPLFNEQVAHSPFKAVATAEPGKARLFENGQPLGEVTLPGRPRFYDLHTEDGVPYWKIATLHSKDVLATTLLQTCVRYRNRDTSCQFCAIEESLEQGKTIAEKTPQQLAEVAKAAVALDGITQMVMTTGTPKTLDRGAAVLTQAVRAVRAAVDIPIQVQCEPPDSDEWFTRLYDAGANAIGMHLEAVTDAVRKRIMPGKASVPLSRYYSAFEAAVKVFGRGNVSTYILAGLGDSEADIIAMSQRLIDRGVYPFIVPFVPVRGTPLADHPQASPAMLDRIFQQVGPALVDAGLTSDTLQAGCAKCGACSALKRYEQEAQANLTAEAVAHA